MTSTHSSTNLEILIQADVHIRQIQRKLDHIRHLEGAGMWNQAQNEIHICRRLLLNLKEILDKVAPAVVGLVLLAVLCACAPARTIGIENPEPWLTQAVEGAVFFWAKEPRRVSFVLAEHVEDADLVVKASDEMPEDAAGFYSWDGIRVKFGMKGWSAIDRICVVAHELGHHLGCDHVEGEPSLMNPRMANFDADCAWSDLDQAEFCRINDCN